MRNLTLIGFAFLVCACASTSTIHTTPLDAEVYINGQDCRVSPCIYHSRYGFPDRMRLQIRAPGYEPAEFFVDTEAPMASYLLLGFGSYVLHGFDKEYHFKLRPLANWDKQRNDVSFEISGSLDDSQIASVLEQCLHWSQQQSSDVWRMRFYDDAKNIDCNIAEKVLIAQARTRVEPKPVLARALVRFIDYRKQKNMPSIHLPWSKEVICQGAIVEYARQAGAGETPPMPAFDKLCPVEAKRLRSQ